MRQISLLLLLASLVLVVTGEGAYWEVKLTSDTSRRYILSAQIATGQAAQNCNFALTTSTPYLTVAGVGCSTCDGVNSYDQKDSTTYQSLGNSSGISLIGNASTSGPLIKETCTLHAENGSSWDYTDQTMIMSNQSASVYGGQISGLFGLASGRATGNLSVSVVGGVFNRDPTTQSVTYGLVLQPPNGDHSADAGTFHWLGTDTDAYTGEITWKDTTASSNSDLSTFEIEGWQFKAGAATVTNTSQNLNSAADPYYVNMFFPSRDAQLIHAAVPGSSPALANDGQSTVYTIPCDSQFVLSTIIGAQVWQVDQTLLVDKQSDGTCVSNIQGWTDTSNDQYLFGSAFLSSLYLVITIANPNSGQNDQIGFARRRVSHSIVAPVVGGVVGGVAGIVIISLGIFFWVRRRDQKKLEGIQGSGGQGGNVGEFEENKYAQPSPFTAHTPSLPPTSPGALSYTSNLQPRVTSGFIEGIPQTPYFNDPHSPPSYDPTYPPGPSGPSQQQQPNLFPGHTRKN